MHRSSDEQERPVADDASDFTGQADRAAGIVSTLTEYVGPVVAARGPACPRSPVGR